jgi:hypothetical protein
VRITEWYVLFQRYLRTTEPEMRAVEAEGTKEKLLATLGTRD